MGYGTRKGKFGGEIQTFWPDDDENRMYIECDKSPTLGDLLFKAQEKWPGVPIANIQITGEKIHTDCLSYDLYDAGDYTDFIILTKSDEV